MICPLQTWVNLGQEINLEQSHNQEWVERKRNPSSLSVTAFHVLSGHPETMKRTGAANV
jgi:hypothetical protein